MRRFTASAQPFLSEPIALVSMSKPAELGVGVPGYGSRIEGNRNEETMFTQVRALLMEVKLYVLLLFILTEMYRV